MNVLDFRNWSFFSVQCQETDVGRWATIAGDIWHQRAAELPIVSPTPVPRFPPLPHPPCSTTSAAATVNA